MFYPHFLNLTLGGYGRSIADQIITAANGSSFSQTISRPPGLPAPALLYLRSHPWPSE